MAIKYREINYIFHNMYDHNKSAFCIYLALYLALQNKLRRNHLLKPIPHPHLENIQRPLTLLTMGK